jgi:arylsulfatase A-like enzyme
VGKWHLGLSEAAGPDDKIDYTKPLKPCPRDHGFDYYFGIPASLDMDPYLYFENDRVVEQPTSHTAGQDKPRGVFWRGGPIAPHFEIPQVLPTFENKATSIIRERAGKGQPFFLYLALSGPHTPWVPLKEYQGKSKAGIYGDFVAQVDATLGRVMKALDDAGAAQNTVVVFTSDNGADWKESDKKLFAHRANASWRGEKADAWDGGHRIPFLVRWPGQVKAGSVSDQLGCLSDFLATAAAVTGFKLPRNAGEDSYNLLPAFRGQAKAPIREAIVHHSNQGVFAIRDGNWKLIVDELGSGGFSQPQHVAPKPGGPQGQLYDLKSDPAESKNLWVERQDVVKRLTALLDKWKQQGYSRPV